MFQHAAPLIFSGRLAELSRLPRRLAVCAVSYFRHGAVVQASLFGDLAQREADALGVSKCLAPRLAHGLGISLELCLGFADGLASSIPLWIVGHAGRLFAARSPCCASAVPSAGSPLKPQCAATVSPVSPDVDHARLQPQWMYVFVGAVVILAVGILVLLVVAVAGFVHLSNEAMAGM